MECVHTQEMLFAPVSGVEASDELPADQNRQGVIAVDAFGTGRVALEPVVETEQRECTVAAPEEIVEGRQQGVSDRSRCTCTKCVQGWDQRRIQPGRGRLSLNRYWNCRALSCELVEAGFHGCNWDVPAGAAPKIVRDPTERADPKCAQRVLCEKARLFFGRGRGRGAGTRYCAVGQLVDPLEPGAAEHDHLAHRPEIIEGPLGRFTAPPIPRHTLDLVRPTESTRREWTLPFDGAQDIVNQASVVGDPAPDVVGVVREASHRAPEEREKLDRQQRGGVRPVFDQFTAGIVKRGEIGGVVAANATPDRGLMSSRDDADRVELQATARSYGREQIIL